MPTTFFYINTAELDSFGDVWAVGRDLTKYDGENWEYYNYQNSVVPSNAPYFLDTRSISIDNENSKWVGCAVTASLSQDLVFVASGNQAATGASWNLSQFSNYSSQSPNWEVPTIYASPYTEEVLAFISPLNGGAGTGGTANTGVTGGYLWRYDKVSEEWSEISPGYTWPHIYEITAKGEGGKSFEYFLSTNDGLQTIPQGNLDPITLDNDELGIKQLNKFNSMTSGIGGDTVYSVSFDENGNYWAGTENGITYWDGKKFYNWNIGNGDGVTKVVARKNGHVFFRIGNPFDQPSTSNGFYHFNGSTFTHLTSANTNLPDNRVIQLMKVEEKSNAGSLKIYEDDLWIVAGNNICLFDYTIPHIYGTSKYTGTTGWNFVYYSHTTEGGTTDTARLPKADKYTWKYPTWRGYDNEYLKNQHPGLDPRNLFLETNFKDIADGSAGKQPYWNDGVIPKYNEQELSKLIQDADWLTDTTSFTVTSANKYKNYNVVTGYSSESTLNFGERNNLTPNYSISNPNPTDAAGGTADVGFVALYSDGGQVKSVIPFRGFATKVYGAAPSTDNSSLFVLGTYRKFIEAGEFVYSSKYPGASAMTSTGVTGPTGGPVGFSNIAAPGLTASSDYGWIINGPVGATSGIYLPETSILGDTDAIFIAEVEVDLGSKVSYGDIDFSSGDTTLNQFALKNFRYFPGASGSFDPTGIIDASFSPPTEIVNLALSVSQNSLRITSNYSGGLSTLKYQWENPNDLPASSEFVFSSKDSGTYDRSGSVIDLNESLSLREAYSVGMTGNSTSSLDGVTSLENALTYLLTGTSTRDVNSRGLSIAHPNPGYSYPFFVLTDFNHSPITGAFIVNSGGTGNDYKTWYNTISGYKSDEQYYVNSLYTDTPVITPTQSESLTGIGTSGGANLLTVSIKPGGSYNMLSSSVVLPKTYGSPYLATMSDQSDALPGGDQYSAVYYPFTAGSTAGGHNIIKRNVTGTSVDEFSTFGQGNTGDQNRLKMHVSPNLNVFVAGSKGGATGPTNLPYSPATGSFVSLLESYKPGIGKDMGDIISRAGSGAWTWVDVHNSSSDLFVPLLSTVFISNYDSKIFGKNSNRWKLTNASNNQVLLDIKDIPYFIYTFSQSGYYSIQNIIEDCEGNVYEISKPAFIKVVDQTIPAADDPNPEFVNSADYGYRKQTNYNNTQEYEDLSKDLSEEQKRIMLKNLVPFGSSLIIKDNPDATFDQF
jgi:hypothetical protein